MKFVIIGPTEKDSAIVQSSNLLTQELTAAGHTVQAISSDHCINWAEQEADILLYQIGENYHPRVFPLLQKYPGIIIIHDTEFPMIERIASQGLAVIVHSDDANKRLLNSCAGPVVIFPAQDLSPKTYANNIIAFSKKILSLKPRQRIFSRMAYCLSAWGVEKNSSSLKYIVDPIQIIFEE